MSVATSLLRNFIRSLRLCGDIDSRLPALLAHGVPLLGIAALSLDRPDAVESDPGTAEFDGAT